MRSTRIMITIWNICTGMRTTTMSMTTIMGRTTTMSMSTAMGRSITMSMSITTGRTTGITINTVKVMNMHMNMCIPMFIGA